MSLPESAFFFFLLPRSCTHWLSIPSHIAAAHCLPVKHMIQSITPGSTCSFHHATTNTDMAERMEGKSKMEDSGEKDGVSDEWWELQWNSCGCSCLETSQMTHKQSRSIKRRAKELLKTCTASFERKLLIIVSHLCSFV